MLLLIALLLALLLAMLVVRRRSELWMLGVLAYGGLAALGSWLIWSMVLYFGIVRIDPVLRWFGAYRLEQPWAALLFFGPPMLVGLLVALVVARRRQNLRAALGRYSR